MKPFGGYVLSLLTSLIVGLIVGEILIWAKAGFPSHSGGENWDLGPLYFPLLAAPFFVIGHGIVFAVLTVLENLKKRVLYSFLIGTATYPICIYLIALGNQYKG